MSDQSKLGLGQIITTPQTRDAIHVAVAPMVAAIDLYPGMHVGLNADGKAGVVEKPIGIVDPFLTSKVLKGDSFWLYLYPGSVTSLRHHWEHPAFNDVQITAEDALKAAARKWMENWVDRHKHEGYSSGTPLTLEMALEFGETMSVGEYECAADTIDATWWRNWEILTGKSSEGKQGEYFSCSC